LDTRLIGITARVHVGIEIRIFDESLESLPNCRNALEAIAECRGARTQRALDVRKLRKRIAYGNPLLFPGSCVAKQRGQIPYGALRRIVGDGFGGDG